MSKSLLSFALLFFAFQIGFTQENIESEQERLQRVAEEIELEEAQKTERIKKFIQANPGYTDQIFMLNNRETRIDDIINGKPIYMAVDNKQAGETTNANELHDGGAAGLSLDGTGVRIAIWDGGNILQTHQEYGGRAINSDPSDLSNHATHVTGTVISAGINPSAKGMAPGAIVNCYDFGGDTGEMNDEANSGTILSNHSYGTPSGWEDGAWFGDDAISSAEDWKFGFYDSRARSWDQIAFNNPNYLIVNSAGNDRNNSGDGSHPIDGPYDCIATYATAKNIMTVGAVRKIPNYNQPSDVVMSSFSSWGPTDDGRIKPDICGAGVGVFSTESGADNDYGSQQGTSMSAPNVMGSLTLVQQAYGQFNGQFMNSSTLKALAIHTAEECGPDPGPDYQFGWGLLNVRKMVDNIIAEDGVNEVILEDQIANGETYEVELNPVANQKITATIVWTDIPGSVSSAQLDPPNLRLVNDLDMVIEDENGTKQFPWILNPANPPAEATKGDNFRDNVEKIEFDNPEPRKYFVRISHKGNLTNGVQRFSLIISYKSEVSGLTNLYWIGNNGNWSNGSNWSLSSGGAPAGVTPTAENKIVFDDNSFNGSDNTCNMDGDFTIGGILWFVNSPQTINLMENTLTSKGNILMSDKDAGIRNGKLYLESIDNDRDWFAGLTGVLTSELDVEIFSNSNSSWTIDNAGFSIDNLNITGGNANIFGGDYEIQNLNINVSETSSININDITADNMETINVSGDVNLDDSGSLYNFNPATVNSVTSTDVNYMSWMNASTADLLFEGSGNAYYGVSVDGASINILENNTVGTIELINDGSLILQDGNTLNVSEDFLINNGAEVATIFAEGVTSNAVLNFTTHKKFCFDNILVENVDVDGNSSVNAGTSSTVNNSLNWFETTCENLLFADFSYEFDCAFSFTVMTDQSSGGVVSRKWFIDGELKSTEEVFGYNFMGVGDFPVSLEVENGGGETLTYNGIVTCVQTTIEAENEIIQNPTQLVSKNLCDFYQWYKDGVAVEGETGRTYDYNGVEALYFVVCADSVCTRQSEVLDLRTNPTNEIFVEGLVKLFPNPTFGDLILEYSEQPETYFDITIVNQLGMKMKNIKSSKQLTQRIDLSDFSPGVYFILLKNGTNSYSTKFLKY